VRALRRRELFRASADAVQRRRRAGAHRTARRGRAGQALADITDATLAAALHVASRTSALRFAIVGMGRLGGHEVGYASDADVLFVWPPTVC
jgi:glutamate-ammonia-ligase adenylyltransferase